MNLTLRNLIGRLNPVCHAAVEAAAGACVTRGGAEIVVEDVLLQLLEGVETDLALLLRAHEVRTADLRAALQHEIERLPRGTEGRPVFSPALIRVLEQAWLHASVELDAQRIRSASIAVALRANPQLYGMSGYADLLGRLPAELDLEAARGLLQRSVESDAGGDAMPGEADAAAPRGDGAIARYTNDFTARAAADAVDPVFCRDREIRQLLDILGRRQKNNPMLVGEAGVGKTAVVEGLALRIAAGQVPPALADARVLELDLSALQAGAGVRGEFEKRLTGLLKELREATAPVVLFIDEAHTLIGAGGEAGAGDAANLLKPVLARGDLKVIGATTWSEYRRYFEKDAALARRFQPVWLPEPSPEQAVTILRGLRARYEEAHDVYVRDDALVAAANLSARYITGRQLPDKAVDLLDTACARVSLALHASPPQVEMLHARIAERERERATLMRDFEHAASPDQARVAVLDTELAELRTELQALEQAWRAEREAVEALARARREARADGPAADEGDAGAPGAATADAADPEGADPGGRDGQTMAGPAGLRDRLLQHRSELEALAPDGGLVPHEVSAEVVARVVSDWTGVPLGRVVHDEARVLLDLQGRIGEQVRGQAHAIERICERIRTAKAGLTQPDAPLGVFLLAGPSGVGKTETALNIAEHLFGGRQALVTVNMSEFQERHTVSRLIGSPPGYVGYGEGGVLTEAVRQRPYSAVLFDEVEKAHPEVMNLFYQLFDKGVLTDGEGRDIDFRNTVIFLTSNLGSETIARACEAEPGIDLDALAALVHEELTAHFRSALLARMEVVPYRAIARDVLREIVLQKLARVTERLRANRGLALEFGDEVADYVLERCTVAEAGARNVEAVINRQVLPPMARDLLTSMEADNEPRRCRVQVREGRVTADLEG